MSLAEPSHPVKPSSGIVPTPPALSFCMGLAEEKRQQMEAVWFLPGALKHLTCSAQGSLLPERASNAPSLPEAVAASRLEMLPGGYGALGRAPGKYHSTSSSVGGHICHWNVTRLLGAEKSACHPCLGEESNGLRAEPPPPSIISIPPAAACKLSAPPPALMLNGVASSRLTLPGSNRRENKQAMLLICEYPFTKHQGHRAFLRGSCLYCHPTSLRDFPP